MNRGEIWWASLPDAAGSSPEFRRPVLIVQSDAFNLSNIQTIIVLAISTNLRLANAPGNVLVGYQAKQYAARFCYQCFSNHYDRQKIS